MKKFTNSKKQIQTLCNCFTAAIAGDFAKTWNTMIYYIHPIEITISFKIFPDRYRSFLPAERFPLGIFWLGARLHIH